MIAMTQIGCLVIVVMTESIQVSLIWIIKILEICLELFFSLIQTHLCIRKYLLYCCVSYITNSSNIKVTLQMWWEFSHCYRAETERRRLYTWWIYIWGCHSWADICVFMVIGLSQSPTGLHFCWALLRKTHTVWRDHCSHCSLFTADFSSHDEYWSFLIRNGDTAVCLLQTQDRSLFSSSHCSLFTADSGSKPHICGLWSKIHSPDIFHCNGCKSRWTRRLLIIFNMICWFYVQKNVFMISILLTGNLDEERWKIYFHFALYNQYNIVHCPCLFYSVIVWILTSMKSLILNLFFLSLSDCWIDTSKVRFLLFTRWKYSISDLGIRTIPIERL